MLKTSIDIKTYERLEKQVKKFNSSRLKTFGWYDIRNSLTDDHIAALSSYLKSKNPNICISILDVSRLPKDAKLCLIASKDEE
jgi:uncharacterized lipoprotein YddW (UPF0748 family)